MLSEQNYLLLTTYYQVREKVRKKKREKRCVLPGAWGDAARLLADQQSDDHLVSKYTGR